MAKRRRIFEYHPDAILETLEATDWYLERSFNAASKFKAELRRAENSVKRHPTSWTPYLHGTRYFKLDRYPYVLVYIERDDRLIGVPVAHLKRRPGYWRGRLPIE